MSEVSYPTIDITPQAQQAIDALKSDDLQEINDAIEAAADEPDIALFLDYLQGERLLVQLASISDTALVTTEILEEVRQYQTDFPTHPLAKQVYQKALRALIRREQWEAFYKLYRQDGTDIEECAEKRYWLEVENDEHKALASYPIFWSKGFKIPATCDPITRLWASQGGLTEADYVRQFENAIRHGQIGVAKQSLAHIDMQKIDLERWVKVSTNPRYIINHYADWDYPEDDDLLLYGLRLLINQDSVANKAVFDAAWEMRGKPETASWQNLRAKLVLYLMSRNDSSAIERLHDLGKDNWTKPHKEWYARLLIRAKKHTEAKTLLTSLKETPTVSQSNVASKINNKIIYDKNIYLKLTKNNRFIKSIYFRKNHLTDYAIYEWRAGLKALSDDEVKQTVLLAEAHEWPNRMIRVAVDKGATSDPTVLYPRPFLSIVEKAAAEYDVSPALIYAVMREESLFDEEATSGAKALGLMQLIPSTAEIIAEKINLPLPNGQASILNKNNNIKIGSKYLSNLIKRFGSIEKAVAAYNAGPSIVSTWNKDVDSATIWAQLIPYKETRNYVEKVLATKAIYEKLYGY